MDMKKWNYATPYFEYETINSDWESPWSGHKNFGYDLLQNLKPSTVVELGTARGTSLFSFAQAVKDGNLKTEIYGVDTWEGDQHAGAYGSKVFGMVSAIRSNLYPTVSVNLLKMYFQDALGKFADNSIDLLHIDGLHTYEAVKNDFTTWLPKLTPDAVVLFHDISESKDDFGVNKFWNELKAKYNTVEFHHSHGLGVLFLSDTIALQFTDMESEWNIRYLRSVYQATKAELYRTKKQASELAEIKASRFYKMKEGLKRVLGR